MRTLSAVVLAAALTSAGAFAYAQTGANEPKTYEPVQTCIEGLPGGYVCPPGVPVPEDPTPPQAERFGRQAPLPEGCGYVPGQTMANGEPGVSCIDIHPDEPEPGELPPGCVFIGPPAADGHREVSCGEVIPVREPLDRTG